jgi:C1A family cysteine protease
MKLSAIATALTSRLLGSDKESIGVLKVSEEVQAKFNEFVAAHGKNYATEEEYRFRLETFNQNLEHIEIHNSMNADDARLGVNFMADWTNAEYKRLLGFKGKTNITEYVPQTVDVSALPADVNWVTAGAVTPVKNQGQCGSCWAFSTTGAMEGRYQIKNGKLLSLSEQQFVDCATAEGNNGCNGGLMDWAFTYAEKNSIDTEAQYPYTGRDGKCTAQAGVATVVDYTDVPVKSPSALMAAVATGPVSVAIDAGSISFQLYMGGIVKYLCGSNLDHGVLLVGYGTEGSTDYWLVKNSWGAGWGEKGYVRIHNNKEEGKDGVCGITLSASYPSF